MIMLHVESPRPVVCHPVIVPFKLDGHWTIKFLTVFQLHTLVDLIRLGLASRTAKRELDDEAVVIASDIVFLELNLEAQAQLVVLQEALFYRCELEREVGEVDKHGGIHKLVPILRDIVFNLVLLTVEKLHGV